MSHPARHALRRNQRWTRRAATAAAAVVAASTAITGAASASQTIAMTNTASWGTHDPSTATYLQVSAAGASPLTVYWGDRYSPTGFTYTPTPDGSVSTDAHFSLGTLDAANTVTTGTPLSSIVLNEHATFKTSDGADVLLNVPVPITLSYDTTTNTTTTAGCVYPSDTPCADAITFTLPTTTTFTNTVNGVTYTLYIDGFSANADGSDPTSAFVIQENSTSTDYLSARLVDSAPILVDAGGDYSYGGSDTSASVSGTASTLDQDALTPTWSATGCTFGDEHALSTTVSCTSDGVHELTLTAADAADSTSNSDTASLTVDTTGPTIDISSPATKASTDWYNTDSSGSAGIEVDVKATDATSTVTSLTCTDGSTSVLTLTGGTASTLSGNFTVTDGLHNVSCEATDSFTNTGTNSAEFDVDQTAPELSATVTPNPVAQNAPATVMTNASDDTSGVDGSPVCDPVDTSSAGSHSVDCSVGDLAGNTTTVSASYLVTTYSIAAFRQPINDPASPASVFKHGSTIPVKFQLYDSNGSLVPDDAAAALASTCQVRIDFQLVSGSTAAVNETSTEATANTGDCFRYDATADQFIYNLPTKGLDTGTLQLTAQVLDADGNLLTSHSVTVGLR